MSAVKEGNVGVVDVGEEKEESGLAPEMEVNARRKAESLLEKCSCEVKKELLVLLVKEETDNVGKVERVVNSGTCAKVSDVVFDSVRTIDLVEVVIKPRAESGGGSVAERVISGYNGSWSEDSIGESGGGCSSRVGGPFGGKVEREERVKCKLVTKKKGVEKDFLVYDGKKEIKSKGSDSMLAELAAKRAEFEDLVCNEADTDMPRKVEESVSGWNLRVFVPWMNGVLADAGVPVPLKFCFDVVISDDFVTHMNLVHNGFTENERRAFVDLVFWRYKENEVQYENDTSEDGHLNLHLVESHDDL